MLERSCSSWIRKNQHSGLNAGEILLIIDKEKPATSIQTLEVFLSGPIQSEEILAARRRTMPQPSARRLILRSRADTRRKSEKVVISSIRCDCTCVCDGSLHGKWNIATGNLLTIFVPTVAACVVLGSCAGDGHEVRDGTHAAGVGIGRSGWAFDTVRDCWCQIG